MLAVSVAAGTDSWCWNLLTAVQLPVISSAPTDGPEVARYLLSFNCGGGELRRVTPRQIRLLSVTPS